MGLPSQCIVIRQMYPFQIVKLSLVRYPDFNNLLGVECIFKKTSLYWCTSNNIYTVKSTYSIFITLFLWIGYYDCLNPPKCWMTFRCTIQWITFQILSFVHPYPLSNSSWNLLSFSGSVGLCSLQQCEGPRWCWMDSSGYDQIKLLWVFWDPWMASKGLWASQDWLQDGESMYLFLRWSIAVKASLPPKNPKPKKG